MKILLDTHAFLWWVMDDPKLSVKAKKLLKDSDHEFFLSVVSAWEIAIKSRLKKISLSKKAEDFVLEQMDLNSISPLSIQMKHALHVEKLPDHHEDPFDRLIVAQAHLENMALLTCDKMIKKYDVNSLW